ncbi:MAG: PEP/pyruvate-binding domain-containing protein, partial [Patescibacteria group bacterium]|nr:PEP/pyruvate-binding domain-containing protein [Patescibacteria group bacterium]
MKALFDPENPPAHMPTIGGKALNLFRLQREGHRVPEWAAVPAECFIEALGASGVGPRIQERLALLDDHNAAAIAAEVQGLILDMPLPNWLPGAIAKADVIAKHPAGYVSVRSSAADEDGATHSFAGIHESFLYIRGQDSVARHVRRVWASGYQQRALLYRRSNGLAIHPVPMAVIIQRMVSAEVSGVAFTADPATQNPFAMVISSLYGLGEGLVGAGLAADHVRYDKRTQRTDATIETKATRLVLDEESGEGLIEAAVPESQRDAAALSDAQLAQVVRTARSIEQSRRRPQDIEFCFDSAGSLFILQTRDITTVKDAGPAAGHRQVWDNANIIESYSGVTSPMTFSFIRHAYTVVYHCFSDVMGIPPATVKANRHVFENMLGLIHGQVYYNLVNWYRLIRQFPGYGMNKRFMESMMGLR